MNTFIRRLQSFQRHCLLFAVSFMSLSACAIPIGEGSLYNHGRREDRQKQLDTQQTPTEEKSVDTNQIIADNWLEPADIEKFLEGRSKIDILKDIQWKGGFDESAEYKSHSVSAISYNLFKGHGGTAVWAIFIDNKFKKFVRYPTSEGKNLKIGDHRRLIRGLESDPVVIADLKKEIKETPVPSHIDWGLTVVWILLRKRYQAGKAQREKAMEKVYQKNAIKNAKLFYQFNASRLIIGMTENEVEKVLKAKPIQTGKVEAGLFKIYGSTESLELKRGSYHYVNVLVVYLQGKSTGIYAIPGGEKGIQQARELMFVDLPPLRKDN